MVMGLYGSNNTDLGIHDLLNEELVPGKVIAEASRSLKPLKLSGILFKLKLEQIVAVCATSPRKSEVRKATLDRIRFWKEGINLSQFKGIVTEKDRRFALDPQSNLYREILLLGLKHARKPESFPVFYLAAVKRGDSAIINQAIKLLAESAESKNAKLDDWLALYTALKGRFLLVKNKRKSDWQVELLILRKIINHIKMDESIDLDRFYGQMHKDLKRTLLHKIFGMLADLDINLDTLKLLLDQDHPNGAAFLDALNAIVIY